MEEVMEQLRLAQRIKPSLDAAKFSLENIISPTKNKTNIIDNVFFFKDMNIKLVFIVLLFICLVYDKIWKSMS